MLAQWDRLCGLVVRAAGYRSGGPGPFCLVSTIEELHGRSSVSGVETETTAVGFRRADHSSAICWH
jgi:hypothetical protein